MHPSRGSRRAQAKAIGECGFEARTHHFTDQRRRRVVAAAGPAFIGIHHPFEHATEHVRRDELAGVVLAHREMEALEQIVECGAPIAVAPDRGAVLSLEWRRFEQPAVEKWDAAERACGSSAPRGKAIEGAEAERVQKGAIDRKSTRLNSSHSQISYAVFCLKQKKKHSCDDRSTTAARDASAR